MAHDDPHELEGGEETRAGDTPKVDWDKIKHAYIYGDWSLDRIADAHGSSDRTIRARARAEGWIRLVGTKPLKRGRRERLPGVPRAKRATSGQMRRRKMIERLFTVLDRKLTELESRMEDAQDAGAPPGAADLERDARSLTSLTRLYAKLVELDDQTKGQGSDTSAATRSDDADQLRRDLALRLERLNQPGNA